MPKTHNQQLARKAARRGRPARQDSDQRADTRLQLLQAASEIMIGKGSTDVSLSEIAEHARLSSALVQYHFGSKDGLLLALVERDAARAVEQLNQLAAADLPVVTKIRLHIGGLINAYYKAPYLDRLLHDLVRGEHEETITRLFVAPVAAFQRDLLERGVREGVLRPISPVEFYLIVTGACEHLFAHLGPLSRVFGITAVTEEMKRGFARTVTNVVLRGIGTSDAAHAGM